MIGIKDFGMPSCCVNCQMCDAYEKGMCVITDTECEDMYSQRNDDCPLVEITESDDCVSREAVIETLKDVFDEYEVFLFGVCGQLPIKCVKAIYSLPSVQPKITTQIDKSNFSKEQYNADLQCAYDCGKASVQSKRDKGDEE